MHTYINIYIYLLAKYLNIYYIHFQNVLPTI